MKKLWKMAWILVGTFVGLLTPLESSLGVETLRPRASEAEILKDFASSPGRSEIPAALHESGPWTPGACRVWKDRFAQWTPARTRWEQAIADGHGIVRGGIEQTETMDLLKSFLQASQLRCEFSLQKICGPVDPQVCGHEVALWFNYVADLTYDESTIVALRFARFVRSVWLDRLEAFGTSHPEELVALTPTLNSLRSPWPMDRIFLETSRRLKNGSSQKLYLKIAQALQKNPYQSLTDILKKTPKMLIAGAGDDVEFAKQMWSDEDLSALRLEVHRMTALQIAAARMAYEKKWNKPATGFGDLTAAHLLDRVPIDYVTGAPWVWK